MPRWTPQQQNAIDAANRNILVSAAAGSGKTAVLVERVIRLITNSEKPVDVDKLLVVTFTNAAAAEMKSRIAKALEEMLRQDYGNSNILKQLTLIPSAKICTIDSFCINLVRENFFDLGINQDFKILDGVKGEILSDNAVNTVTDEYFEANDKAFLSLVEMFSNPKNVNAFSSVIKQLHSYIYSQPFPFLWLKEAVEKYNPSVPMQNSEWYSYVVSDIKQSLNYAISMIKASIVNLSPDDELFSDYTVLLNDDLRIFETLISALDGSWDCFIDAVDAVSFSKMPFKRGYESPSKAEINGRRTIYKNIVSKELSKYICLTEQNYIEDIEHIYPLLCKLYDVVLRYDKELFALEEAENEYSFSDIEHFAIKLLYNVSESNEITTTQLADDLADTFYEILIDEYQDTNRAQDMIFQALSNGHNRFMVGDIKQSIYRFRLAMPEIFNEKKESYEYYSENSTNDSKIILDKNFRSDEDVCKYVNYIFSAFMQKGIGDIEYNADEYLNYGASFEKTEIPSAQLKILTGCKGEEAVRNEARYVANTILNKVKSKEQIWDKDHFRNIVYSDFAVLLRSSRNYIGAYSDALKELGIPVFCDNTSDLFESNEIKILVSLLRVIDNPLQDIPLLTVMMSALYGFTADDLAQIRVRSKKGNLYKAVLSSDLPKVQDFLAELKLLRKYAVTMSVSYFIRFVCEYKSIFALAGAMGNGEQRCLNINRLIDFAKDFDDSDSVGLTAFIYLLDKVAESDRGIESPSVTAGSVNAVSIMSVHHSKGLEFPVVILAGASRRYNMSDLSDKMLLNPIGIGVKRHNEELLCRTNTIPYLALQGVNKRASMGENLRVLYVAVTRAKQQFISFVTVDNLESRLDKLSSKMILGNIEPDAIKSFSSDADFLLASALMHQNGKELRKAIQNEIYVKNGDFRLEVEISDLLTFDKKEDVKLTALPDDEIIERLQNNLSYSYEHIKLSNVSAKRTASALDDSERGLEYFALSKPAFLNNSGMTAGEKGSAMHAFMQFCDYKSSAENLEGEIKRLADSGRISREQADCLNRNALSDFFSSAMAERMLKSNNIYREIKVSSFVKLCDIDDTDSEEEILIRGISDCVFEENGELVIVDYKTDRVTSEQELLDRYKNQLAFYKNAVSKTLKKNVKQVALYSFYLGKACYYN